MRLLAKTLPVTWPMDFATTQTRAEAFADLAGLWGLSYPAKREDYCTYAKDYDLGCLARTDSLETLRNMNRPAMLTLYADDGAPFHVVMASLVDDKALFIAGDTQYEMALAAITSRWFGEYLLLWQRPPFQRKLLQPGAKGDSVGWLAETLQELGVYEATGREVRLEGTLLGAFKRFQFSNGLDAGWCPRANVIDSSQQRPQNPRSASIPARRELMSFILEALKKSEQQRQQQATPAKKVHKRTLSLHANSSRSQPFPLVCRRLAAPDAARRLVVLHSD